MERDEQFPVPEDMPDLEDMPDVEDVEWDPIVETSLLSRITMTREELLGHILTVSMYGFPCSQMISLTPDADQPTPLGSRGIWWGCILPKSA